MNFQAIYINSSNEYDHKVLRNMLYSNDFKVEFYEVLLKAYNDCKIAYNNVLLKGLDYWISCDDSLGLAFIFDFDNNTFKLKIENFRDHDMRLKHGKNADFTYEFFGQWLEFEYNLLGA